MARKQGFVPFPGSPCIVTADWYGRRGQSHAVELELTTMPRKLSDGVSHNPPPLPPVNSSLTGFAINMREKGMYKELSRGTRNSESDAIRSYILSDIFIITIYDSICHRKSSLGRY